MRYGTAFAAIALLCVVATTTATVTARAKPASLAFEATSGRILQADDAFAPRYPASLTKLMTTYLVLQAIRDGRLTWSQKLTISRAAAGQSPVKLGLRAGRTITVRAALDAIILRSANDAAVVLAEAVSGDEHAFALKMTATARKLAMRATRFVNATGLPDRDQVTTAYDMAILTRALLRDFSGHLGLFSRTSARHGKRRFGTVNGWLTSYRGADGFKTGFTCGAGYNLVASATREKRRIVAVVLGAASRGARAARARKMVDAAFAAPKVPRRDLGKVAAGRPPLAGVAPPHILSPTKCAHSARRTKPVLEAGPFPGWGLVLGSYTSRSRAVSEIATRKATLGKLAAKGRPAVVARARGGVTHYRALLVALDAEASLASCRQLRAAGVYCRRLDSKRLNNARATWR